MDPRRRRLELGIGDLEQTVGDVELASRRHFNRAATEIDGGSAPVDVRSQVSVADCRQTLERAQRCTARGAESRTCP